MLNEPLVVFSMILLALVIALPLIVWALMDRRHKDVAAVWQKRFDDLQKQIKPAEEVIVVYGKLNNDLHAMLSAQLAQNTKVTENLISIASRQVQVNNPLTPVWPPPDLSVKPNPEDGELDSHLMPAGDMVN